MRAHPGRTAARPLNPEEDMHRNAKPTPEEDELRRRAPARLASPMPETPEPKSAAETQRLVRELKVRQLELEAKLERCTELYDCAPIGLFTLGRGGAIAQTNLAGAALLGREHAGLRNVPFSAFVAERDRPVFEILLREVFDAPGPRFCEVVLGHEDLPERIVAIEATLSRDQQECHCVVVDITDRKLAELQMQTQLRELQRWQGVTLDREERIQELKGEVNLALARAGQSARYPTSPPQP